MPLNPFDFTLRTRLVFGSGAIERLGEFTRDLPARRALIVSDPGILRAGHVERAIRSLEGAGVEPVVFSEVHPNPSTLDVAACVACARSAQVEAIIGLGGGSSLDTAKGCNFVLTNGGTMEDYWGTGLATRPMLPFIAVPTTAGTGSECQSYALIAKPDTHQKMACGDPKATARVALLDPDLTLSQPSHVTACTGIDAIAHAVETAVTNRRNPVSDLYSREAFRLLYPHFSVVLREPANREARAAMLLGAAYAGIAIENSMLGAAHSLANPLTAHYGVVHGQAVGMLLPSVIRMNGEDAAAARAYRDLAAAAGLVESTADAASAVEALACAIEGLLEVARMPAALGEVGVAREKVPLLAEEAARQWTAQFNPRPVAAPDFERLYAARI